MSAAGAGPLAAGLLLALAAAPVRADDELPAFRSGWWEFRRSVDGGDGRPATLTNLRCTNPADDLRKKRDSLVAAGCRAAPVTRRGNLYSFGYSCRLQGIDVETRTLLTYEGESAYKVDTQSMQGGRATREQLKARRIGNCPESPP